MYASATGARRTLFIVSTLALSGVVLAWWLGGTFAGHPDPRSSYSAFYVIFARDEVLGLTLVAVFGIAAGLVFFGRKNRPESVAKIFRTVPRGDLLVMLIAAGVFAVTALGTYFVCHDYPLSADEFMADFQAKIFLRGQVTAEVPLQWIDAVRVIKPTYADYFPATHSWKSAYLPVYAAMRAVFQSVSMQALLNPFLAAVTILALFGTLRNIWPNDQKHALVGILLLTASAQFLVMAMTAYSMPAHLALNTLWLWLYSRPDRSRFYLAPVVGVFAIGLHQPIVHALFAAPFLVRLVIQREWRVVSVFGVIYLLGCAGWYAWRTHYSTHTGPGDASFFRLWNPKMLIIQPMDLLLVIGWSALATPLLAVLGFRSILQERPIIQDAAISCLLTFGFYYFFRLDQGHGWGYRYFHGTLTCLTVVAVAGWEALVKMSGSRTARNFLTAGVLGSLVIALPLRSYQAETFIRPFARASKAIHSMDVAVVGVDPRFAWYSADLIRNDPFLERRPVVAALIHLRLREVAALTKAGKARFVTREELRAIGLSTTRSDRYRRDPFDLGWK